MYKIKAYNQRSNERQLDTGLKLFFLFSIPCPYTPDVSVLNRLVVWEPCPKRPRSLHAELQHIFIPNTRFFKMLQGGGAQGILA